MKIKTKKLSASVAQRIAASLVAGSLVFCTGSFAFAADANGNNKTISNETASEDITGGSTSDGDANNNTLTVTSSDANDKEILGGSTGSLTGTASNNTVFLRKVRKISYVDGGIAARSSGDSNYNTVYIWDSDLKNVHGGHTGTGSANYNKVYFYSGTVSDVTGAGIVSTNGEASFNELYIYGGTLNGLIQGGYTYPEAGGRTNHNLVEVYGGTINGQLMGGYVSVDGQANNNTVNIYGGTINGEILGGHVGSGEVKNNTINIYGGDISNASLRAGDIGGNDAPSGSGNAINFHTKDIVAKQVGGFDYVGFVLPRDTHHGDIILTLTGGSATNWNGASVKVDSSKTNLNSGDKITLVTNSSGLNLDINNVRSASAKQIGTDRNIISYGVARDNYVHYADEGNTLTATVQERVQDLKPQVTLLAEPSVSVRGMIDAGTNRILNWLPPEEIEMRSINQTTDYEFFTGVGGEVMSIDTGNGSKLKNKSGGQNIGAARTLKNRHGLFIFAPITDYGAATYDTTLAQTGTRGGGNSNYFTAGLIARQMGKDGKGMYYEASFRVGKMRTNFTSDNFEVGNERSHVSYRASTPVYTGHVRIGWRGNVSKESELDLYGLYSHNHIGSIDANLQIALNGTEQKYKIDSTDSKTVRLGARLTRKVNDHNRFYSGLMYQYQFGGDVRTNFEDCSTPKVGVRGSSGMVELGWQLKPTPNSAVMLDSALVGWVGKQKGLSFQVKLKKDF